jgi:hypothetical protein
VDEAVACGEGLGHKKVLDRVSIRGFT